MGANKTDGAGAVGRRFFTTKNRPFHLGPYPLERLARTDEAPDFSTVPAFEPLDFSRLETPHSLVGAMGDYQAMMDAIRAGAVNPVAAAAPEDLAERANHIKAFGYFSDASQMGIGLLPEAGLLADARRNPEIDRLAHDLQTRQTKTLASGIDLIMADLKDAMSAPPTTIEGHTHVISVLVEDTRPVRADEPGAEWIAGAMPYRSALRATEIATVLANYLRAGLNGRASRFRPRHPPR